MVSFPIEKQTAVYRSNVPVKMREIAKGQSFRTASSSAALVGL